MQIILELFLLTGFLTSFRIINLYLFDLCQIDDNFEDYLVKEKRVNFKVVNVTFFVLMNGNIVDYFY